MPKYLRMTIDVAVFDGGEAITRELTAKNEGSTVPSEDGESATRYFHHFGTGERIARRFMERIQRGDIEIDDIRDVEVHGD